MRNKLRFVGKLILLGFLSFLGLYHMIMIDKLASLRSESIKKDALISELQSKSKAKESQQRQFLIEWVYANSSQISTHEARIYVVESLKYPHSLLLISVIEAESEFNPSAISKARAIGPGQVNFAAHGKTLIKKGIIKNRRDLFNVAKNIEATSFLFEFFLVESKGDIEKTLQRYLGGKDGRYVLRILRNFAHLNLLVEGK